MVHVQVLKFNHKLTFKRAVKLEVLLGVTALNFFVKANICYIIGGSVFSTYVRSPSADLVLSWSRKPKVAS